MAGTNSHFFISNEPSYFKKYLSITGNNIASLPNISREKALDKINGYLNKVNEMKKMSYKEGEDQREELNVNIRNFIPLVFEDGKQKVKEFDEYVNTYVMAVGHEESSKEKQQDYTRRIGDARKFLTAWKEELEIMGIDKIQADQLPHSNKVFIVHGHDEHAKVELENILHRLKLEPIVLQRKADMGRTTIEKFEAESKDSGYAFVMLTPDDDCLLLDKDTNRRKRVMRARQNVLLELGFFIASLGRDRVCAIYKKGVDIPSDYSGVLYKEFDNSVEELYGEVRKELATAGYQLPMY